MIVAESFSGMSLKMALMEATRPCAAWGRGRAARRARGVLLPSKELLGEEMHVDFGVLLHVIST